MPFSSLPHYYQSYYYNSDSEDDDEEKEEEDSIETVEGTPSTRTINLFPPLFCFSMLNHRRRKENREKENEKKEKERNILPDV